MYDWLYTYPAGNVVVGYKPRMKPCTARLPRVCSHQDAGVYHILEIQKNNEDPIRYVVLFLERDTVTVRKAQNVRSPPTDRRCQW